MSSVLVLQPKESLFSIQRRGWASGIYSICLGFGFNWRMFLFKRVESTFLSKSQNVSGHGFGDFGYDFPKQFEDFG